MDFPIYFQLSDRILLVENNLKIKKKNVFLVIRKRQVLKTNISISNGFCEPYAFIGMEQCAGICNYSAILYHVLAFEDVSSIVL